MVSQLGLLDSRFQDSGATEELLGTLCLLSDLEVPLWKILVPLNQVLFLCLYFAVNTIFLWDFHWMSSTDQKGECPLSVLNLFTMIPRYDFGF